VPLVATKPFGKDATEFEEMLAAFGIDPGAEGARYTGWNAPDFRNVVRGLQQCMKLKFPDADDWGPSADGKFSGIMTEKQFRFWQAHNSDCPSQHSKPTGGAD
jgi:hypothetical protein